MVLKSQNLHQHHHFIDRDIYIFSCSDLTNCDADVLGHGQIQLFRKVVLKSIDADAVRCKFFFKKKQNYLMMKRTETKLSPNPLTA